MPGAFPGRVLKDFVGEVFDFVEAEFLALVDVGAAGQGQHEQGCRSGAAGAQGQVGGLAVVAQRVVTPVWARP